MLSHLNYSRLNYCSFKLLPFELLFIWTIFFVHLNYSSFELLFIWIFNIIIQIPFKKSSNKHKNNSNEPTNSSNEPKNILVHLNYISISIWTILCSCEIFFVLNLYQFNNDLPSWFITKLNLLKNSSNEQVMCWFELQDMKSCQ